MQAEETPSNPRKTPQTTQAAKIPTLAWPAANRSDTEEDLGKGQEWVWQVGNWVMLQRGAQLPWAARTAPNKTGASPDQGPAGSQEVQPTLAGCHYFSCPSQKRWNRDYHSTTILGNSTLPCSEEAQA